MPNMHPPLPGGGSFAQNPPNTLFIHEIPPNMADPPLPGGGSPEKGQKHRSTPNVPFMPPNTPFIHEFPPNMADPPLPGGGPLEKGQNYRSTPNVPFMPPNTPSIHGFPPNIPSNVDPPPPWVWVLSKILFNNNGCPPSSPWIAFKHAKLWHGFPIFGSKLDPPSPIIIPGNRHLFQLFRHLHSHPPGWYYHFPRPHSYLPTSNFGARHGSFGRCNEKILRKPHPGFGNDKI